MKTHVIPAPTSCQAAPYGRWVAWAFALLGWQVLTATVASMM